jgi:2-polyprenyl-3-methyl-5-hydroxy-6-metoxy-1,4-benzoquinol methylase
MQTSDDLHELWLGDLSDKKVLDLGVGGGNALSVSIASRCKEYHAIDLSEKLAKQFQEVLNKKGLQSAHSYKADFLSEEFSQKDFDIIYALGVAHHFEDFDLFLGNCTEQIEKGRKNDNLRSVEYLFHFKTDTRHVPSVPE